MECFAPGPRSEVGRDAKGDELKGKVATGGFVAALVAESRPSSAELEELTRRSCGLPASVRGAAEN